MSDAPAFLVITSTPNPDKMEELQSYLKQVMPVLMSGGGKPVGRYRVTEQVAGHGGPKTIAIMEYPSAQAIRDLISGDGFNALNALRAEVFLSLDLMISEAI